MANKSSYSPIGSINDYYYSWLFTMDDDVEEYASTGVSNNSVIRKFRPFYSWTKDPFLNTETGKTVDDACWEKLYEHISIVNLIIEQVKNFPHDSLKLQNRVKGEALFLRGTYYYLLINFYAPPYTRENCDQDLGVPLKLTEYVEDVYFTRDVSARVYQQIVMDLKESISCLEGIEQSTFYRGNVRAARLLLSRIYLYMGEWELAKEETRKLIEEEKVQLWDLNNKDWTDVKTSGVYDKKQHVLSLESPEILFTMGNAIMCKLMGTGSMYIVSSELQEMYKNYPQEVEDLRYKAFFSPLASSHSRFCARKNPASMTKANVFETFVLRAAEAYLNKAEAEAMLDDANAISTLKNFMSKRFSKGNLPAIDHLKGKDLIEFIRAERRREFCFEGQRWFDLRRYAVDSKYPTSEEIRHVVYESVGNTAMIDGAYVLKPYAEDAPAYTLPIPQQEIDFNKGAMVQNPERPEREKSN